MTLSILGAVILTVVPGGRCDHQCHHWGDVILIVATGGRSDIVNIGGCNSHCRHWGAL